MASSTRSKTQVFLLGTAEETITGSKLPSSKQVLLHFCYHHLDKKKTVREAAAETLAAVTPFWERAHIPTQKQQRAQDKIVRLHQQWWAIKKNQKRRTKAQETKEEEFVQSVNDLFDIAHKDALAMMKIDEDKEFLKAQREKGRRGCMLEKDMSLATLESRRRRKRAATQQYREKIEVEQQTLDETVQLTSSSSSSAANSPTCPIRQEPGSEDPSDPSVPGPSTSSVAGPSVKRPRAAKSLSTKN